MELSRQSVVVVVVRVAALVHALWAVVALFRVADEARDPLPHAYVSVWENKAFGWYVVVALLLMLVSACGVFFRSRGARAGLVLTIALAVLHLRVMELVYYVRHSDVTLPVSFSTGPFVWVVLNAAAGIAWFSFNAWLFYVLAKGYFHSGRHTSA